eukprot:Phypoly_transcript_19824.p1 GENE.Phypoly_transcript_19824~~Phypoly_transcript_19824.p1  ORF type:complete len:148 (-),score=12.82 Phypoly_transcript_19824:33-476(-)
MNQAYSSSCLLTCEDIKGEGFPVAASVVEFSLQDTKGTTNPTKGTSNPSFGSHFKMHSKGPLEDDHLSITLFSGTEKFAHKSVPVLTLAKERKESQKKEFTFILNPEKLRKEVRQGQGAEWGQRDTMVTFVVEWPSEAQMKQGSAKL